MQRNLLKLSVRLLSILVSFAGWATIPDQSVLMWNFPLNRTHTGIPLANGTQGILVWGAQNELTITVAHAGFWDHRGGRSIIGNYSSLTSKIALHDEAGIRSEFVQDDGKGVKPMGFQQLGGADWQLHFPTGWRLENCYLDLGSGKATVIIRNPAGVQQKIRIYQSMYKNLLEVVLPPTLVGRTSTNLVASYRLCPKQWQQRSILPPDTVNEADSKIFGFTQKLPEDPGLTMVAVQQGNTLRLASALNNPDGAITLLKTAQDHKVRKADQLQTTSYWQEYWQTVPQLRLEDQVLQEAFDYGLYMQAICLPAHAQAATLQGPLMEAYQMPPWAADYHWNVNVQMMYWSALSTGRADQMKPLWAKLKQLIPQMQQEASSFYGVQDGLFLPHATDDRGKVSGTFWAGYLDGSGLPWLADMAWNYFRFTNDTVHLKEVAIPLLKGSLAVLRAMCKDTIIAGKPALYMPYTVSPEWRGTQLRAVGKNSSYQLAATHRACQDLIMAMKVLNRPSDQLAEELAQKLPQYAKASGPKMLEYDQYQTEKIGLFEGQDLIETHRHHSHLAGLYPFKTIQFGRTDSLTRQLLNQTLYTWQRRGAGSWTGWSTVWASIICAYSSMPDAAVSWLHHWSRNFVNEGRGTLHDARWPGLTTAYNPNRPEVMQLDARLGAIQAVVELMVQVHDDEVVLLPGLPADWHNFSFHDIQLPNGFTASALVKDGKLAEYRIYASRPGQITVRNPLGTSFYQNEVLKTDQPNQLNLVASEGGLEWIFRNQHYKKPVKWLDWNPKKKVKIVYP